MNNKIKISLIDRDTFAEYFNNLFFRSIEKKPFDILCSLLRVDSYKDAGWDPFLESEKALEDYSWLLEKAGNERSEKCRWRIGLLMYCQLIEMTVPHELLSNFLRCLSGQNYHIRPFERLIKRKKNQLFSWIPPSATMKFNELKKQATTIAEQKMTEYIDSFFNEHVRNAFSHSDYIITDKYFRWTESGLSQEIPLEELNIIISNCFSFYGALFWCYKYWLKQLAKTKKYHKLSHYMILEILSNEEIGIYGFYVHFSNGNKATYTRTPKGTTVINISFDKNGQMIYHVGSLDDLERVWKINGKPVENWNDIQQ
jgi:hypothetical protein